jgi:hypothetical protein
MVERATILGVMEHGIWVSCGSDGTWLHFESGNGPSAAINVENWASKHGYVIKAGLLSWCADRQKEADKVREQERESSYGYG